MASTFSPNLRIELIGAGEQAGAWNNTTNSNLGILVEQAISGAATVSIGSNTNYSLTTANGASDQARNMVLEITGTPGGAFNVICPTAPKVYIVKNSVTGNHTMTFKTSTGSGVTIPNGRTTLLYCDGVNVLNGLNELPTGATLNGEVIATTTGTETLSNKTLTAPKIADTGFIADPGGNRMLSFDTLASAALTDSTSLSVSNGPANLTVTGASGTGTTATILYTAGNSTQIPVGASVTVANITPSGYNGTYIVTSSSIGSISYANTTTAAWSSGGTIAVAPVIASSGTGSNIDINIVPKGSGVLRASGVEVATVSGTQTLSNKTIASPTISSPIDVSATAGNAAIIEAVGPDADIDIDLVPKGNGSILFNGSAPLFVPTGSVIPFAGTSAPTGWLLSFGQAVSRTTYADLFAVIGTTYGTGDGSTTFNLPDLRGRVAAGQDDMGGTSANRLTGLTGGVDGDVLGGTGGLETHTLTTAQIPAHNHLAGIAQSGNSSAMAFGSASVSPSTPDSFSQDNDNGTITPITSNTGGGQAHNNVQPTIILNYIIKI